MSHRALRTDGGQGPLAVTIRLSAPLGADLRSDLEAEALEAPARRGPGLLVPRDLRLSDDGRQVDLRLDPFDAAAVRLDLCLNALAHAGSGFGSPVAALLAGAIAARLRALHAERRPHGEFGPRHVLVGPGGGVALLAPGLPLTRTLMVPSEPRAARARRRAPEVLLGAPPTPRSDVHVLGALYYELLSGAPYRANATLSALRGAARAALPPELPGALPDPRPPLVELLARALAPNARLRPADAAAFLAELKRELGTSGLALADRSTLAGLLAEYVPEEAARGARVLVEEGAPPMEATVVRASPFATADAPGDPPSEGSDWARVLGEVEGASEASSDDVPSVAAAPPPPDALRPLAPSDPTHDAPSMPAPPDALRPPASSSGPPRLSLPSADAVRGASTGSAPPSGLPQLETSPPQRKPPTLEEATRLDRRTQLVLLAGGLTIVGAVALIGVLRSPEPGPPEPRRALSAETAPRDAGADRRAARRGADRPTPAPRNPARSTNAGRERTSARGGSGPKTKPTAWVSIMSRPSGATVLIDGGYVGTTPLVIQDALDAGRLYTVTISADDHHDWERRLRPDDQGSLSVVAELEPVDEDG